MHRKPWIVALPISILLLSAALAAQEQPTRPAPHMGHGTHAAPPAGAAAPAHPATPAGGHSMAGVAAAPADVASPEAILAAFYEAISGPAGKPRDRNRFVSLFFPGGRLLPVEGKGHSGTMPMQFSPQSYLYGTQGSMLEDGFLEKEIARRSERFGKLVQVWSTYEARHAAADAKPFVRGVNSFQLVFDGKRWWIFSLVWQPETAQLKLPAEPSH